MVLLAYPVEAPAPPGQCNCHLPKKRTRTLLPTLHTWPAWPLLPTPFLLRRLVRSGRACLPWDVPSEWHLPSITRSKSLAYPVAPAPPPCGRPPLPTLSGAATGISARPGLACSTAVGRDFPGVHSRPPSLLQARPPAPSKANVPLMPARKARTSSDPGGRT